MSASKLHSKKDAGNPSFQSIFLLLVLGLIWGSGYSIAHYATTHHVASLGYSFWQSLGPSIFLLCLGLFFPHHRLSFNWPSLQYYAVLGLFGIAFPNSLMYLASPHLPAGLLAVVVNTVPIFTFLLAISLGIEGFQWFRALGVILTFIGLLILSWPGNHVFTLSQTHWIWLSLLVPMSFAAMAIFAVKYRPKNTSDLTIACGMLVFSTIFVAPATFYHHDFYALHFPLAPQDWAIILEIVLSSISYIILFKILQMAGAIFYSLVGGMVSLTGLLWAWIFFHEGLNIESAAAALLIILGIVIVAYQKRTARNKF
jgi:drug/metabolite transporter (DMT)-like permease